MLLKAFVVAFLLEFSKEVLALKCFNCFDVTSELHEKNDCYYPENGTTPIVTCPTSCYFFQWGEPFLHDNTVYEILHTVRSCEPSTWEQCDPQFGGTYRKLHCITCDTDLCNTSSQISFKVVFSICVFLLLAVTLL